MLTVLKILVISALLAWGNASAQGISIIQGSDGTSGTVMELGNGFRTYSDSHGNMGTIMDLGGGFQTYQFTSPHGGLQSGTILTLPAPRSSFGQPAAGLAPAPMLPFTPRGPIMPREQMTPVAPPTPMAPSTGTFNAFGSGGGVSRFGR
ncbi:MAG TPA: hypothetical protein VES96_07770 [Nitrospiraceae bacterium]|nr:hypothetical protein [Nitrospiraceae bacterium]